MYLERRAKARRDSFILHDARSASEIPNERAAARRISRRVKEAAR
jgi:hypothetical protein